MALTWLILGLALGTFLLRFVPLFVLSRVTVPSWVQEWLRLVPGAVLAAAFAQALLVRDDQLWLAWDNPYMWAALPALVLAWRTRSVLATMLGGMLAFALLEHLLT